jgi:hypothetical protein
MNRGRIYCRCGVGSGKKRSGKTVLQGRGGKGETKKAARKRKKGV